MNEKSETEYWRNSGIRKEVRIKASLSGGKGGQNVNKVSTKVELYWSPDESFILDDLEKEKVKSRLGKKLTQEGELRLVSEEERSQLKNKEKVFEKFHILLASCFKEKKKRKNTKPTKSSIQKRLSTKAKIKDKKSNRKKPDY